MHLAFLLGILLVAVTTIVACECKASRESGRCWVDYATVFYWYQDTPGGYAHAPLESVAERQAPMLTSNAGIPRTPGGAPATR